MEAWATLAPQIAVALVIVACAAWLAKEMRRKNGGQDSERRGGNGRSLIPASKSDVAELDGHIKGRLQSQQTQLDGLSKEQAELRDLAEKTSIKLDRHRAVSEIVATKVDMILNTLRKRNSD